MKYKGIEIKIAKQRKIVIKCYDNKEQKVIVTTDKKGRLRTRIE